MKCPNDGTTLLMNERNGVEIDYCPECRGVWLDRGELDKIIERSVSSQKTNIDSRNYSDPAYNKPKKKESFLSDLFDF